MLINKIKPIPKYIINLIKKEDKIRNPYPNGNRRFYSYLTKNDGELVKVTVAVKHKYKKWYCKQVSVHGVNSDVCFTKDLEFFGTVGYVVGWYYDGLNNNKKWYETDYWCEANDKHYDPYAPVINREYALKFNEFKYSALNKYRYEDIFKYLRLYKEYPECEMLVKFNLSHLATSKTILKMCHKNKSFRKWLIKNSTDIYKYFYDIPVIIKAFKTNRKLKVVQKEADYKKDFIRNCGKEIKDFIGEKDIEKFINYIDKQNTNYSSYEDYIRACRYLNIDLSLDKNRFPKDLKRWHDIRIDQYHTKLAKENEEKRKILYKNFEIIAKKYNSLGNYANNNFICIIAQSPDELVFEGKKLNHCVGKMNYDQKFAREESLIFFVRNKQQPDAPFVTLEYSLKDKKILQCYGEHDSTPPIEVLDYVNKIWLPYANRKLKKIA